MYMSCWWKVSTHKTRVQYDWIRQREKVDIAAQPELWAFEVTQRDTVLLQALMLVLISCSTKLVPMTV
jgi:hypothetical protein